MDKTNIIALVQSIERSLHLIYKNLFSIKKYEFLPKLAWICLKNHAVLRHCGYTFTLDGQKSLWGGTGSGGCTAKCAAKEDETWLWPWQCYLSMFSSAAAGVMNTVSVFFLARARKKWIPISRWSLRMTGCQLTWIWPFPPHKYKAYAFPLDITEKNLSCLKATPKADISSPEI